ncbi:prolyl oligopeptidase family serine peptidase, partial [Bacteriovoracaceae bacterium]|nr:prolyl oligopeptidase family serine peptidase [Bacteriovoracaceae bacterium]
LTLFFSACSSSEMVESTSTNIYRRLFIPHPTNSEEKVEFYTKSDCYKRPKKTIIFLHGHQEKKTGGEVYLDWNELTRWQDKGFLAVAISLPGYGGSTGKSDFSGPYSQDAVEGVIDFLLNKGWADSNNLNIQGVSRGGIVAGRIASRRNEVKKLVLISTSYDLKKTYEYNQDSLLKKILIKEMNPIKKEFEMRSIKPDSIKADMLILHGKQDKKIPFSQVKSFFESRLESSQRVTRLKSFNTGHRIPLNMRKDIIDRFINE